MKEFRDMTVADFYNPFESREKSKEKYYCACEDLEILNEILHKRNSEQSIAMRYRQDDIPYKFCLTVQSSVEYTLLSEQYIWDFISAIDAIKETLSVFEVY